MRRGISETMKCILEINEWLNRRVPGIKPFLRLFIPRGLRAAFASKKFSIMVIGDSYNETFKNIYPSNWWGSKESASGCGSESFRTSSVRDGLVWWIKVNSVADVLDAPCGDFNWMKGVVDETKIDYIGGDIVEELMMNNQHYATPRARLLMFDILRDTLPKVDAWICRDVLFHFPNAYIQVTLERFVKSDIRFLLTTHFIMTTEHPEIEFGGYRPVNLCEPPFNWPPPSHLIFDGDEGDGDRYLGVWRNPRLSQEAGS